MVRIQEISGGQLCSVRIPDQENMDFDSGMPGENGSGMIRGIKADLFKMELELLLAQFIPKQFG